MMIGRRAMMMTASLGMAGPAWAVRPRPDYGTLAFRLMRHGSQIGHHTWTFTADGDRLTVAIEVAALVTLLSIPVVRYAHHATERWQGETLVGLASETDKNGQQAWMKAERGDNGLVVTGSHTARYIAPEGALGTTYWNKHMLDGPMISAEDGALLRPTIKADPAQTVARASGEMVLADHYALRGAFNADIWYDRMENLTALAFPVADGSSVQYQKL